MKINSKKEMQTIERAKLVFATLALGFILMLMILQIYDNNNTLMKEVKCYDRYSNEIKGLTCTQDPKSDNWKFYTYVTFIFLVMVFFMIKLIKNER
jgi:hypothetical protein